MLAAGCGMNAAFRSGGQGGQQGDMSLCVPLKWAEGDKGDNRGTRPLVSRPVGGQDRTKPLGLSYVPLAVRARRSGQEIGNASYFKSASPASSVRAIACNLTGHPVGMDSPACRFDDAAVALAVNLRQRGWPYSRIAAVIGCSDRLASYWVRGLRRKSPVRWIARRLRP